MSRDAERTSLIAFVDMVALAAPGLDGWEKSRSVLSGAEELQLGEFEKYKPQGLPRNEQRRASDTVRLAFKVGEEIKQYAPAGLDTCASVFASSGGDFSIVHQVCETLCTEEKSISPTRFHNSVHNAPSGYWAIATGSHQASVSLAAFDDTFIFGLLEAMTMIKVEQTKVLLIAYDIKPPFPLSEARQITRPFATGILLSPVRSGDSQCEIEMSQIEDPDNHLSSTLPGISALTEYFHSNPIARCLPMLEYIASGKKGRVTYAPETGDKLSGISLSLTPC